MSIQQYVPPQLDAAPVVHTAQVSDLVQWAAQAEAAYKLSQMICNSEFTPQQYRGQPEKAAAAMLAGSELGFSPMTALNAYDVIQGQASLKARTMLAIVQSKGHYVKFLEKSATKVVVEGHRAGQPETLQTAEWTIKRADVAGYVKKNPNYVSKPQEMLVARATSEICRAIASDALLGIAFTTEELQDDPSLREPHPDSRRALPSPRAAQRGGTSVSAADLTGDAPMDAEPAESTDVQMIDKAQQKKIGDAFKAAGVNERALRTRIVDALTDRPVKSALDLTRDEAETLIGELEEMGPEDIAALADIPAQTPDAEPAGDSLWPEVKGNGGDQ